jgi:carbonic anhydrase/acetyltransferase-like protein (isoleucine patch superfamily)
MTEAPVLMRPLLVLPFNGTAPTFASPPKREGSMAAVLGRATIGRGAMLGDYTLIRADGHFVRIGDDFSLGSGSTVHIAHDVFPTIIGDRVAVGRNAVVHACTLGNDCVVGDDTVILDGSVLEAGVVIENGALVFPRSHLVGGHVYAGRPAKPIGQLRDGEVRERADRLRRAEETAAPLREVWSGQREHRGTFGGIFVAATARVRGEIDMAPETSIWFACDIDAGACGVSVGENSNIQDNTVIRCKDRPFVLGANAVIGHNVQLGGCTIGDGALVGIGSVIAEGTTIDAGVLVAAGTETTPGQHLEGGWLWGGSPARPLSEMNAARHDMIASTISTYRDYAKAFAREQRRHFEAKKSPSA